MDGRRRRPEQLVQLRAQRAVAARDLVAVAEPQASDAGPRVHLEDELRVPRIAVEEVAELVDHRRAQARGVDPAAERHRRGGGRLAGELLLGLLDLGVRRREPLGVLDDDAALAGLLVSTRPRTSTISSAASSFSTASRVFSNTTISTLPSRSSIVANIIGVPERKDGSETPGSGVQEDRRLR